MSDFSRILRQPIAIAAIAAVYFLLAKAGLYLASINPSASPIWPPSGFALAILLLAGFRVWPGIALGAFLANVTTAGTVATSLAIACGNTLEAMVGAYLVNRWSKGLAAFDTPGGVARFAAICLAPPVISATCGVGALALAGLIDAPAQSSVWLTWWIGDVAGALVLAPVILLWTSFRFEVPPLREALEIAAIYLGTVLIGLVAFSPLYEPLAGRGPIGFLAVVPLIAAALRRSQRDTATIAIILCGFAIWGALAGRGPFAQTTLNDSFLLLLMFMISATVPSLALSADASVRRRTEAELRRTQSMLDQRVQQRTEELAAINQALQREIDQRMQTEAKLRLEHAHLLEAQRVANLGSWVWDLTDNSVTWSERLYDIYGRRPDQFGGTFEEFAACLHEGDRERVKAEVSSALAEGRGFQMTERIVRPDGAIRVLQSAGEIIRDRAGKPSHMVGVCQDVTEKRDAEDALRVSETRYRLIVESIHDYAIYMLDSTGHIASWNPGAARIKGYTDKEIIGQHFKRFFTPEDREAGVPERAMRTAAKTGKYESEGWRVRKDGTRFFASVVLDAVYGPSGEVIGYAKITRDITERREHQLALEQAREQLAQAQKMEALGQLTGGIAHDFNNLLMIVSGHAQLLQRRMTDEKQLQAVEAIRSAASRGENLTRQLLAFSRRQALSPSVIELRERIEALREMLGSSLRGNIDLVLDIPGGVWPVKIDISELDLALVNLAVNARDAMPEGGTIRVSARNITLAPGEVPGINGDFVALTVTDTGSGIPPDVLPRIFEPFFTTKAVGKGTGLGLSQVYGFAHQSNGSITVSSVLGQGTVITMYLPRTHDAPEVPVKGPREDAVVPADGLILAVEDNPDVAGVTSTLIEDFGYRVVCVANAMEALQKLRNGNKFDLVFSDIVMPGTMDGLALAHEIRKEFPDLPIVLTTGYSEAAVHAEVEFPVLRKPFSAPALERVLRDAIARSAASN